MGIFKRGRPSQQAPQAKPGLYYFRNKDTGAVDYVGESSNLRNRKAQHIATGKLDPAKHVFEFKIADGRATSKTRREHERLKIDQHKPDMNGRGGGGGRPAK